MATSYITAIGINWPDVECHAIGDGSVYANLVWDAGSAIPSQATLDAWITANAAALTAGTTPAADVIEVGVPSIPPDGTVKTYARNLAGKLLLGQIDPDGISRYVQNSIYGAYQFIWMPGVSNGLGFGWGSVCIERNNGTGSGKIVPTQSNTNVVTQMQRLQLSTGSNNSGADGLQSSSTVCWRGNAAGCGGFLFFARFALETYVSTERIFVGLATNNATMAAQPSSWHDAVGLIKDSGDSTLQIFEANNTTGTKHNTGVTPSASQILELALYCKANDTEITAFLMDAVTGTVLVDNLVLNTTLPTNSLFLYAQAHIQSTLGSTSKQLSLAKMYVETEL